MHAEVEIPLPTSVSNVFILQPKLVLSARSNLGKHLPGTVERKEEGVSVYTYLLLLNLTSLYGEHHYVLAFVTRIESRCWFHTKRWGSELQGQLRSSSRTGDAQQESRAQEAHTSPFLLSLLWWALGLQSATATQPQSSQFKLLTKQRSSLLALTSTFWQFTKLPNRIFK